jgi:anti-anti-sigma factor
MAELEAEVLASQDGTAIVAVRGELDIATVDQLAAVVAPLLDTKPARLVFEAEQLHFADSSGIALWVMWAAAVEELQINNPPQLLRRVITTMGLAGKIHLTP